MSEENLFAPRMAEDSESQTPSLTASEPSVTAESQTSVTTSVVDALEAMDYLESAESVSPAGAKLCIPKFEWLKASSIDQLNLNRILQNALARFSAWHRGGRGDGGPTIRQGNQTVVEPAIRPRV